MAPLYRNKKLEKNLLDLGFAIAREQSPVVNMIGETYETARFIRGIIKLIQFADPDVTRLGKRPKARRVIEPPKGKVFSVVGQQKKD